MNIEDITLLDQTRHYFGGYYHVRVMAFSDVSVERNCFDTETEFNDAFKKMGATVRFERVLQKMAVPEAEIESVRAQLIHDFYETATKYILADDFAPCFVQNEYRKQQNKTNQLRTPRA